MRALQMSASRGVSVNDVDAACVAFAATLPGIFEMWMSGNRFSSLGSSLRNMRNLLCVACRRLVAGGTSCDRPRRSFLPLSAPVAFARADF